MKTSFRDPITNVLKAYGFVSGNQPGDLAQPESDDFNLTPGRWQWNGNQWIPFVPPPPPTNPLKAQIDTVLADATVPASVKALLTVWKSQL